MPREVLIVGASAAGFAVAEGLRAHGYGEGLTVVGDEFELPYDRPPLSKQILAGEWCTRKAMLASESRLDALGARLILGAQATGLRVDARTVDLDRGEPLRFDQLVIATGVRPRLLSDRAKPDRQLTGVHILRTLRDSLTLRARLMDRPRLLILGAGFLGLEVAATANGLGAQVTVVDPDPQPLTSRLGTIVASRLLELHQANGVDVRPSTSVTQLVDDGCGRAAAITAAELSDGTTVQVDLALVAIGSQPCTEWLEDSGLDISDGVLCDSYGRAAPHVWAAGDVARWRHPGSARAVRLEHRVNATEQGHAVARSIASGVACADTSVPFFWTQQYETRIQVAGLVPSGGTEVLLDGTLEQSSFTVGWITPNGAGPIAVVGWNAARAIARRRAELRARRGTHERQVEQAS